MFGQRITSVALRFAQHWKFMATGSEAVWQQAFSIFKPSAVVSPPRPMGPMPRELILSSSPSSSLEEPGIFSKARLASLAAR